MNQITQITRSHLQRREREHKLEPEANATALDTEAQIPTLGFLKHPTPMWSTICQAMHSANILLTIYYMPDILGIGT